MFVDQIRLRRCSLVSFRSCSLLSLVSLSSARAPKLHTDFYCPVKKKLFSSKWTEFISTKVKAATPNPPRRSSGESRLCFDLISSPLTPAEILLHHNWRNLFWTFNFCWECDQCVENLMVCVFMMCFSLRLLSSIRPALVKKINRLPTPAAALVRVYGLCVHLLSWTSVILFYVMLESSEL